MLLLLLLLLLRLPLLLLLAAPNGVDGSGQLCVALLPITIVEFALPFVCGGIEAGGQKMNGSGRTLDAFALGGVTSVAVELKPTPIAAEAPLVARVVEIIATVGGEKVKTRGHGPPKVVLSVIGGTSVELKPKLRLEVELALLLAGGSVLLAGSSVLLEGKNLKRRVEFASGGMSVELMLMPIAAVALIVALPFSCVAVGGMSVVLRVELGVVEWALMLKAAIKLEMALFGVVSTSGVVAAVVLSVDGMIVVVIVVLELIAMVVAFKMPPMSVVPFDDSEAVTIANCGASVELNVVPTISVALKPAAAVAFELLLRVVASGGSRVKSGVVAVGVMLKSGDTKGVDVETLAVAFNVETLAVAFDVEAFIKLSMTKESECGDVEADRFVVEGVEVLATVDGVTIVAFIDKSGDDWRVVVDVALGLLIVVVVVVEALGDVKCAVGGEEVAAASQSLGATQRPDGARK